MLPVGLTIPAMLTQAGLVVGEFDGLITLVVGFSLGFFVISWVIAKVKAAKRG